ncbi:uncharacterized protein L969DRAFT_20236 [Mixia osmundae IAM 14324]|uniref:Uncharacterized protein n=1 Tax=Mixia osmundae (strain CBS 9802 / IAM 14324 / JCM 22182 / KY 12970) TaxID=764103 RepID=G7DW00_MIXOS|nr:uncharacterized protein L969DRAFT_20236 [Mixia osmundae IAM 14324]KEI36494.1 hypothetical protein L969DRAFT_20236 [Mixia osmundae IAM 14324]GAA94806.1 hypothetical protein E5Q_01460 [Mixia osmundae IAM 14324]
MMRKLALIVALSSMLTASATSARLVEHAVFPLNNDSIQMYAHPDIEPSNTWPTIIFASVIVDVMTECPQGRTRLGSGGFSIIVLRSGGEVELKVFNKRNGVRAVRILNVPPSGSSITFAMDLRGFGSDQVAAGHKGWSSLDDRMCCRPWATLIISIDLERLLVVVDPTAAKSWVVCPMIAQTIAGPDRCGKQYPVGRYECTDSLQSLQLVHVPIGEQPAISVYPISVVARAECPDGPAFTNPGSFKAAVISQTQPSWVGLMTYDRVWVSNIFQKGVQNTNGVRELQIAFSSVGSGAGQPWPDQQRRACCYPYFRTGAFLGIRTPRFRYAINAFATLFKISCYPDGMTTRPYDCERTTPFELPPMCHQILPQITLMAGETPIDPVLLQ